MSKKRNNSPRGIIDMKFNSNLNINGVDDLIEVREELRALSGTSKTIKRHIQNIGNFIENKGSLNDCLNITPGEKVSSSKVTDYWLVERNRFLYKAWKEMSCSKNISTSKGRNYEDKISYLLEESLKDFLKEWDSLSSKEKQKEPSKDWSKLRKNFYLAFQASDKCFGRDMPYTKRSLHGICMEVQKIEATPKSNSINLLTEKFNFKRT
jgi:hypothetical protein